jgi:hypothetical protein
LFGFFCRILLILVPLVLKWRFRYRAKIFPRVVQFGDEAVQQRAAVE